MGPIWSSIGNWSNTDVIYSLDIGQMAPIHITNPFSISLFDLDWMHCMVTWDSLQEWADSAAVAL